MLNIIEIGFEAKKNNWRLVYCLSRILIIEVGDKYKQVTTSFSTF